MPYCRSIECIAVMYLSYCRVLWQDKICCFTLQHPSFALSWWSVGRMLEQRWNISVISAMFQLLAKISFSNLPAPLQCHCSAYRCLQGVAWKWFFHKEFVHGREKCSLQGCCWLLLLEIICMGDHPVVLSITWLQSWVKCLSAGKERCILLLLFMNCTFFIGSNIRGLFFFYLFPAVVDKMSAE